MSSSGCYTENSLGSVGQESNQGSAAATQIGGDSGLDDGRHVEVARSGQTQYILNSE